MCRREIRAGSCVVVVVVVVVLLSLLKNVAYCLTAECADVMVVDTLAYLHIQLQPLCCTAVMTEWCVDDQCIVDLFGGEEGASAGFELNIIRICCVVGETREIEIGTACFDD